MHGEEARLPGMNLTNEQIFFISFARVSNPLHDFVSNCWFSNKNFIL